MRIVITGANGQLGRALQKTYTGHDVAALSHADLDIGDEGAVRSAIAAKAPQLILNAAAYNNVDGAEDDSAAAFRVNRDGPRFLAAVALTSGAAFVHVSTDYVFDGEKGRPYVESDPTGPLSVYAKSKLAGEQAVLQTYPASIVVRTSWVFGAGNANFLTKMEAAARKGPLRVVNDQFSSPTYAGHLAEAIAELVQRQCEGIYHVSGSGTASRYDQFKTYAERRGLAVDIAPVPSADFPQKARRPKATPLISEREPILRLPDWKEGVRAYVQELVTLESRP